MSSQILLPTDLSDLSWKALPHAVDLTERLGAQLHVIAVIEEMRGGAFHPYPAMEIPAYTQYLEDLRGSTLAAVHEKLGSFSENCTISVRDAVSAAKDIVQYTQECNVDMVVMATHGRTGLQRFLLGSTTEQVLRTCPVPVLSIPARSPDPERPLGIQRVLFPTDRSEASWSAFPKALDLAKTYDAQLTVLSVIEEPYYLAPMGPTATRPELLKEVRPRVLKSIHEKLEQMNLPGEVPVEIVQSTQPAEAVVQFAEERDIGLMVMATQGRTGFDRMLIGSTAERIVRLSEIPVLTVRGQKESKS